jgi:glucose-1-phosphate thymidylyltransferase
VKGVILAGGTGSRLVPLTTITNKHLLPVYDKPMIYYPIASLVGAGVTEIMVVTGGNHAGEFLRLLKNGKELGCTSLHYAYQEQAGGIAQALDLAHDFVDGDRCIVVLGDNVLGESIAPYVENFRRQQRGARILLKEVEKPEAYGVPIIADGRIIIIQEKPQYPRSPYAVIGLYMYDSGVWDIVRSLKPSGRGELEITDVNNAYIDRGLMEYDIISGWWGDCGESFESYRAAFNYVAEHGANRNSLAV